MNLLEDPILTARVGVSASLPGLLAAMARDEPCTFPSLRPHQRPAWHMFLVQLSALALWTNKRDDFPVDEEGWKRCLRALTPDHPADEPWRLAVVDLEKPAFLQSPVPGDQALKWSPVETPDDLDVLITSRNHDLKQHVVRSSRLEDWIFALVSAQTTDGYGGRGHQGVARMNGGSSSRPMVGLAPAGTGDLSVAASAWWARDVQRLMEARRAKLDAGGSGVVGGHGLLWCLDWLEADQLPLGDLDPWFIEVCRRIRLKGDAEGLSAQRSTSAKTRVDAKAFKGNVGDPWSPVHKSGKSFTLTSKGYDYKVLCDLLFSGDWERPLLAKESNEETDMLLIAEGISRGNSKTEGYRSRILPVPRNVLPFFSSEDAGTLSKAQIQEIGKFDAVLRNALALVAANGERGVMIRDHFDLAGQARARFDRVADKLFFPSLWERVRVAGTTDFKAQRTSKKDFLRRLQIAAEREFELAVPSIPCAAIRRPKAEARARRMFHGTIRKEFEELLERGSADATG